MYSKQLARAMWPTSQVTPLQPPSWDPTFTVTFIEQLNATTFPFSTSNRGSWFYDYPNRRARFDHNTGNRNDFCFLSGMNPSDPSAACSLYFTSSLEMFVAYPAAERCCSLCGKNNSQFLCTPLKPTWLNGATYRGQVPIEGSNCSWWRKPGAVASDNWFASQNNTPCMYQEHYENTHANIDNITDHQIVFDQGSYDTRPPAASTFTLPPYCTAPCPHPLLGSTLIDKVAVAQLGPLVMMLN